MTNPNSLVADGETERDGDMGNRRKALRWWSESIKFIEIEDEDEKERCERDKGNFVFKKYEQLKKCAIFLKCLFC